MRVALFVALATLTGATPRFHRVNERTPQGRSTRGLMSDSLAFFEAFPASGAGTTTACSTTAPTGARGEVLTFTRASNATCTKTATGGLATTGIANGDLVSLAADKFRVMYDSEGYLGGFGEQQGVNLLPRFDALTNAAWSDVGTPTVTDGATDPFGGTTGDTIDDNDAAAFEGRSQPITVAAGAAHYLHCYVKAGTQTAARISLDGTTTDLTGLSTSTWSIIQGGDASSSGVSISVQVLVGDAASDTGTVIWGGCDVKTGASRSTIVPTVAAAATRVSDVGARFPVSGITTTVSIAASANTVATQTTTGPQWISMETTYGEAAPKALGYSNAGVANTYLAGALFTTGVGWTGGQHRLSMDTGRNARFDATTTTTSAVVLSGTPAFVVLTGNGTAGLPSGAIVSRICVDPDPLRCR